MPYAASKAGLLGLTRSVAAEAAAALKDVVIRSNAIVPGYVETPMIAGKLRLTDSKVMGLIFVQVSRLERLIGSRP